MAEHTPPALAEATTGVKSVKRKAGGGTGVKAAQLPPGLPIEDVKIFQAQHQQ